MRRFAVVPAVVLAAVLASPAFAADEAAGGTDSARHDAKIANIRKLVHIMSGKQMKDMMDAGLQSSLKALEAQMPADAMADPETRQALDEYLKSLSFTEKDLEEMLDLMIPVYDKHLDEADVAALVAFYESPAGKNFVRVMPDMMTEVMPWIMGWQMEKLKGPMEMLRKRLEGIQEKRMKGTRGADPGRGPRG